MTLLSPAIEASAVEVRFGGLCALDAVDFVVASGERRVILGPNGAGKTTLFNVLAGVNRPRSGKVLLHGEDMTALTAHRRASAGLARTFQITNLMASLSLRDNVVLALMAADRSVRRQIFRPMSAQSSLLASATGMLEQWGLADRAETAVGQLSYGEQRQAEIVLALASRPRVLLLDEPTAGLSSADTESVVTLIEELPRDLTLVLIEHDLDISLRIADSVTVLAAGRIRAEGRAEDRAVRKAVDQIYLSLGTDPAGATDV
jgi:branched-chain amino acid transport system ATP-binding protein